MNGRNSVATEPPNSPDCTKGMIILMRTTAIKNAYAIILAVCILFVIALSVGLTAAYADHHCTGTDCSVCHAIIFAQNVVKAMGAGFSAGLFGLCTLFLLIFSFLLSSYGQGGFISLYSLKVKLNN